MKIGMVLDDSLDKSDGVQQHVLTLGKWYKTQGHEVHYLVGHTERGDIPSVHSLSRNLQVHFNQNRMSTPLPASRKRIRQLLNDEQFDVLHVQMPFSPFLAGRIIRLASPGTAIAATFHIIPYSWFEQLAARLLGLWCWRSLRRIDTVYSVSRPAQLFAKKAFGAASSVLPNPVSLSDYEGAKSIKRYIDGKLNIVFLGRLVERKGCGYLLQALEKLHKKGHLDRVRVLICGKGPLEPELRDYVKKAHLGSVVHFKGFVSEKEKLSYLATADIAVMPSTGGESFGIVLIEAMAAGAQVVIGGDNSGYRYVLGERPDQLVSPRDTAAFASKLRHFMVSGQARKKARDWQKQHVRQFDVKVIGQKLLDDYEILIAKRQAQ